MLPPKSSGTIVDRASPLDGATPRHPRNGASGTSQVNLPSVERVRATPRARSTSENQRRDPVGARRLQLLDVNRQRVARLGPFDEEGSGLRIVVARQLDLGRQL